MTMSLARWFLISFPIAIARLQKAVESPYSMEGESVIVGAGLDLSERRCSNVVLELSKNQR